MGQAIGDMVIEGKGGWVPIINVPVSNLVSAWMKDTDDGGILKVYVSRDPAGLEAATCWHLSISHIQGVAGADGKGVPGRQPTYEEIKEARYRFVPDDVNMVEMFPPRRLFFNDMPTCHHLWEIPVGYAE